MAAEAKTEPVSGTPLDSSNNSIRRSAARKPLQWAQERRRAVIIGCGILFMVGLGFALVMTAELSVSPHLTNSPQLASVTPDNNSSSATITIDSADGSGCRQQVFDNQTGRMTRSQKPCDTTARDSSGVPIPLGTIHRLDAISKSFSGK
jgi:hypothetical protein